MSADEIRALVREYLTTPEYPEGWIEPDEISDAGAPDLLMARELWRLVEQYEVAVRERDEARSNADGMARAPYGEFEKMREERDVVRDQLQAAQAELAHWKSADLYPLTYREAVEELRSTKEQFGTLHAAALALLESADDQTHPDDGFPIEEWLNLVDAVRGSNPASEGSGASRVASRPQPGSSLPSGDSSPASAPVVGGLPCKGTGAEYLVEQDNSNPASNISESPGSNPGRAAGSTGEPLVVARGLASPIPASSPAKERQ